MPSGSLTGFCLDHLLNLWKEAPLFSDSAFTMQTQLSRNQKKEDAIN